MERMLEALRHVHRAELADSPLSPYPLHVQPCVICRALLCSM